MRDYRVQVIADIWEFADELCVAAEAEGDDLSALAGLLQ